MRRNYLKLFVIFSVAILLSSSIYIQNGDCQSQKNFLWRVQSKVNTIYVLGSLHFSKKEIYPLHQNIEKAFDQSEFLVVEANVNDIKKVDIQKISREGSLPSE